MKKTLGERLFKTSAIVSAVVALYYVVTLDNVTNVWQYIICFVCLVYLIFVLCVKWDEIIKTIEHENEETEIVDIDDYKKK